MKANKYRIYPTSDQKVLLEKHFGHARHVYNWALAEKEKHYKETGKSLSRADLQKMMVAGKKRISLGWQRLTASLYLPHFLT